MRGYTRPYFRACAFSAPQRTARLLDWPHSPSHIPRLNFRVPMCSVTFHRAIDVRADGPVIFLGFACARLTPFILGHWRFSLMRGAGLSGPPGGVACVPPLRYRQSPDVREGMVSFVVAHHLTFVQLLWRHVRLCRACWW